MGMLHGGEGYTQKLALASRSLGNETKKGVFMMQIKHGIMEYME